MCALSVTWYPVLRNAALYWRGKWTKAVVILAGIVMTLIVAGKIWPKTGWLQLWFPTGGFLSQPEPAKETTKCGSKPASLKCQDEGVRCPTHGEGACLSWTTFWHSSFCYSVMRKKGLESIYCGMEGQISEKFAPNLLLLIGQWSYLKRIKRCLLSCDWWVGWGLELYKVEPGV